MSYFFQKFFIGLLTLCSLGLTAADLSLLSNNIQPGAFNESFPSGTNVSPTTLTATWVTTGEYATDPETISTGKEGAKVLFDGNTGSNWKSRTYSKWSGGQWVTLVVDLGALQTVEAFDVWALHEATRDTGSFTVLLSEDGKNFKAHGTASSEDQPKESKRIAKISLKLDAPVKARYVQFRMKQGKGAKQQQIAEIAIWGERTGGEPQAVSAVVTPEESPAQVPAQAPVSSNAKTATAVTELHLLSNNIPEGRFNEYFPKGTKVQATDLKLEWVTTGEYATDPESISTGKEGGKVLVDGNAGSNWKSRTYSKWNGGQWVTVVADLGSPHAVQAFDVWALHEATRDTEAFFVLLSDDGENFTPHGMASSQDQPLENKFIAKMSLTLDAPVKARYVKFRIKRLKSARQQQIAEISIWGSRPEEGVHYLGADSRPKVQFTVETIQAGIIKVDWSENRQLHDGVSSWKIYTADADFENVKDAEVSVLKTVPGKFSHALVYPMIPGKEYVVGVTAVYPQGEYALVNPVTVKMPMPLECDTFGDMVAVNHFWGGGGHRNSRGADQASYDLVALDLLGKSGIKQTRWWVVDPKIYKMFYEKGVGVYTYPHSNNIQEATKLGVYAFSGPGNEPDLKTTPISTYVTNLKKVYEKIERENPDAVVCAPSSGLEDSSIAWLDKFYELGGKDYFDVLDLHTYCKIAGGHVVPEGYPAGAPEAMYDNMRKINEILVKYGDADKPVISTEFGYSDALVNNPSGRITPQIKAEFLVRGLIIHHSLGFKRVFMYSFWDEGEDMNFSEHRFGLLDYDLQKKEAYYAVETSLKQIGDSSLEGPVENLESPSFGYVYRKPTGEARVSVIWDGAQRKSGVFQTQSKTVRVVDMYGHAEEVMPDEQGQFSVTFGASPVYLHTEGTLKVVRTEEARPEVGSGPVLVHLEQAQVIVAADAKNARLPVELDNPNAYEIPLQLIVKDGKGETLSKMTFTAPASERSVAEVVLPIMKDTPLALLQLNVVEPQPSGVGSRVTSVPFYLRSLRTAAAKPETDTVAFPELEKPVYVLSSPELAVSIDAARGGRLLEFIDRASATNQVRIDYAVLPNIDNIPFAFGIWDTFNGKLKNAPMDVVKAADGQLELTGKAGDLEVTQLWTLKGNTLTMAMKVHNGSGSDKAFSYKQHPEYTVGGVGESVVDVLGFPRETTFETIPFWSGLGKKKSGELFGNWWAAVDTVNGMALKQQVSGEGWAEPGVWFGQGHYNIEFSTVRGFKIAAGQTWEAQSEWSLYAVDKGDIQTILESLR
ncbi:discoidin domain-containing protein [Kiritimatiellota bacterium B12222]|nr:discoidin domain-containing protein [Kiritimatiellota bacterium B12222]